MQSREMMDCGIVLGKVRAIAATSHRYLEPTSSTSDPSGLAPHLFYHLCLREAANSQCSKFIMFHFESLRCKVEGCGWFGRAFATKEILYLHEQKEHGMHKGGGRFLCTSPGCGRSRPGNGFANRWVQLEHIKNVHENIPDLPPLPDDD